MKYNKLTKIIFSISSMLIALMVCTNKPDAKEIKGYFFKM